MTAALPILAALAPLMAWDGTTPAQLRILCLRIAPALLVAAALSITVFAPLQMLLLAGLAMAAWLAYGSLLYLRRARAAQVKLFSLVGLRQLASAISHFGLALFVLGMALTATLKQTYEMPMNAKAPMVMGDYSLRLVAAKRTTQNNYTSREATIEVSRGGHVITTLTPELRYFSVRAMQTAEAALHSTLLRDIYIVLGESTYANKKEDSVLGVRMYITPGQQIIWIGFLLTAAGGGLAMLVALRRAGGK
jgi:cytochrome c-type biogenesis protein CcmF